MILRLKTYLNWPVNVGLLVTQDNLPGDSDSVEEVVDEAHVVDERVHVTGAQHEQGGQTLQGEEEEEERKEKEGQRQFVVCWFN